MNKYTDTQRIKAIWDGCSTEDNLINRAMEDAPQPKTLEDFKDSIDNAIDAAIKEGYIV
jgi:hypothetical protein